MKSSKLTNRNINFYLCYNELLSKLGKTVNILAGSCDAATIIVSKYTH